MKKNEVQETVSKLRNAGYRVFFNHYRFVEGGYLPQEVPQRQHKMFDFLPKGGRTEVIIKKNDEVVAKEEAHCCMLDNYQKALGVKVALGRLLKRNPELCQS